MSITASTMNGGSNGFETGAAEVSRLSHWFFNPGVPPIGSIGVTGSQKTGDFAVQAQASPNKTVKIKAGKICVLATPTGEAERLFLVSLSADYNLTIPDNASGGTRYVKVYVKLPADSLANPPVNGDLTETACILVTDLLTSSGTALGIANAYELAEITLANNYSSVADTAIAEKRMAASVKDGALSSAVIPVSGWVPATEAWTRTGDSTFTITGDYTGVYSVGDKVKVTDTTTKYFYITAASYSAPNTTFTITGGSDYVLAASPTARWYSKTSNPVGFPSEGFNLTSAVGGQKLTMDGAKATIRGWHYMLGTGTNRYTVESAITLGQAFADADYSMTAIILGYKSGSNPSSRSDSTIGGAYTVSSKITDSSHFSVVGNDTTGTNIPNTARIIVDYIAIGRI